MICWGEVVWRVREMQGAEGRLTSGKGPGRKGIRHHEQGIAFPSKKIFFYANTRPLDFYMCVQNKKEFSPQVNNKSCVRIRIMRLFWVHRSSW